MSLCVADRGDLLGLTARPLGFAGLAVGCSFVLWDFKRVGQRGKVDRAMPLQPQKVENVKKNKKLQHQKGGNIKKKKKCIGTRKSRGA